VYTVAHAHMFDVSVNALALHVRVCVFVFACVHVCERMCVTHTTKAAIVGNSKH
jgi:hypothetical protein